MHYYYPEHLEGYKRVKAEGKTAWNEIHGAEGYDNFSSRAFLETVLPCLTFSTQIPTALEYGCGTGPSTCFLAERGFRVDAIDLVPLAIEMGKEISSQRGLSINFEVGDVCNLKEDGKQYDLIVDSYCLQCIVFDDERQRVFSSVQSRLKPSGYYLVSTAILDEEHEALIGSDTIEDSVTGVVYNEYGGGLIDLNTGIVLRSLNVRGHEYSDAIRIAEKLYLPNRRHLQRTNLISELQSAGFMVVYHDERFSQSVACKLKDYTS